jgi:hypothetical protein
MKALISPNENNRVAQVEAQIFEVAEPLFWVDCLDTVTPEWTYVDGQFVAPVIPESVVTPEPTKAELLAELELLTAKIQALGND